jgi:hypothetical protein
MDTMKLPEIEESLIDIDRRNYVRSKNPSDAHELHSVNVSWAKEK